MSVDRTKHNPVQIVLNANDFIDKPPTSDRHDNKDFYDGRNAEFVAHKEKLLGQTATIGRALSSEAGPHTAYVKAKLRDDALAKIRRPVWALFKSGIFPAAGADGLGEPIYEVTAATLPLLAAAISSAESDPDTRFDVQRQKTVPAPSRERSEVGAIEELSVPHAANRQAFSVDQATQWLSNPDSGQFYLLNLFNAPLSHADLLTATPERLALYRTLIAGLNALPFGVVLFRGSPNDAAGDPLLVRPVKEKRTLAVADLFTRWTDALAAYAFDESTATQKQLLDFLSNYPLVRRISLPPLVQGVPSAAGAAAAAVALPSKVANVRYPRVGVIDSGIADNYSEWVIGKTEYLIPAHREQNHGTFISGLLVAARAAGNPEAVALEDDGCEIYDVAIFPDYRQPHIFAQYYKNGFLDFLAELNVQITTARQRHQVRIFNLSINVELEVNETQYSELAAEIDKIAAEHDVIIVISAGNLPHKNYRTPWPSEVSKVAGHLLAKAGSDRIYQPAESVYSVTAGSINPPGVAGHIHGAPAAYTRRGPGMRVGIKPDFAHYGGATILSNISRAILTSRSKSMTGDSITYLVRCRTASSKRSHSQRLRCRPPLNGEDHTSVAAIPGVWRHQVSSLFFSGHLPATLKISIQSTSKTPASESAPSGSLSVYIQFLSPGLPYTSINGQKVGTNSAPRTQITSFRLHRPHSSTDPSSLTLATRVGEAKQSAQTSIMPTTWFFSGGRK